MYEEEGLEKKISRMYKGATQTWKSISLDVSTQPTMYEEEDSENKTKESARRRRKHRKRWLRRVGSDNNIRGGGFKDWNYEKGNRIQI